jgi:pimeloyl-ACP methyl ester carboxylesterase
VTCPTLVMQGDRDEMPVEHSATLFRALADAHLAVVPGASHGLLVERPELCNAIIGAFLR